MKDIDLHLLNAGQSFKMAINHAFDLGWEASEERIIKLIYEYMDDWESQEEHMEEVIALIKGEK